MSKRCVYGCKCRRTRVPCKHSDCAHSNYTSTMHHFQDLTLLSDPDQVHLGMNMVCACCEFMLLFEHTQVLLHLKIYFVFPGPPRTFFFFFSLAHPRNHSHLFFFIRPTSHTQPPIYPFFQSLTPQPSGERESPRRSNWGFPHPFCVHVMRCMNRSKDSKGESESRQSNQQASKKTKTQKSREGGQKGGAGGLEPAPSK